MSSVLLAVAVWLLPPGRAEWGEAMRAELASLATPAARRGFALSCVRASLGAGQLLRLGKYVTIVAGTVALTRISGIRAPLQVELILVGATAPLVVWRLGRRNGPLGVVGSSRAARVGRRAVFGLAGAGLAVAAGFLSTIPAPPETSAVVAAVAVLVTVLAGYLALAFAMTAATSPARAGTLSVSGILGAVAGLVWCVLKPYNETLALPGSWTGAVPTALLFTMVGLPVTAAVLAVRRGRSRGRGHVPSRADDWQAVLAGTGTGLVAGLVILIVGTATVWSFPRLLDTGLVDQGPQWRPPDLIEQVIPGYFWLLVVAPAFGGVVGWLVGKVVNPAAPITDPDIVAAAWRPFATRTAAVAGLLALGLLAYPYSYIVDNDNTGFWPVGTTSVVFPATGGTLLTANADYTWILWDVTDPARPSRLATFNEEAIYSPDGGTLASRNLLWSLADPAHAVRMAQLASGEPLAFSPDGTLLVTRDRRITLLWNVTDRRHPTLLASLGHPLDSDDGDDSDAIFSPDGGVLFVGESDAVAIWDVHNPGRPALLSTVDEREGFTLAPDGGLLAFEAFDNPTVLWRVADPARPTPLGALPGTAGQRLVFSSDHVIATTIDGGGVQLWRLTDQPSTESKPTGLVPVDVIPPDVVPADVVRAGTIPAGPSHPQIGASDPLATMAFSADGHTLSIVTGNATTTRWDVTDPNRPVLLGAVTRTSYGPGVVGFSPDRSVVAGAAPDALTTIALWRVA